MKTKKPREIFLNAFAGSPDGAILYSQAWPTAKEAKDAAKQSPGFRARQVKFVEVVC